MLIRATCEKACGKFPSSRSAFGSYSSERRPTSLQSRTEPLEHLLCLVVASEQREVVGEPEARHQEGALGPFQAVDVLVGVGLVSTDEAVGDEPLLDRLDGADDARVIGRQEADRCEHEQARVEQLRAVVLGERVELRVEALLADLRVDFVAQLPPMVHRSLRQDAVLRQRDGAVEGHPGHDLRMGEVPPRAADLPDPVVGLAPHLLEVIEDRHHQIRRYVGLFGDGALPVGDGGVQDLAVDVELELGHRFVADADGR